VKILHEESFPKTSRLTKRSEFLDLFRRGRKIHTAHFVLFSKPHSTGGSRLGLTVSTKVGNAVVRNRVKRRLREFFRRQHRNLLARRDLVIVAKKGAGGLSSYELDREIHEVLISRRSVHKNA
jgi:ribonuclease P protein component